MRKTYSEFHVIGVRLVVVYIIGVELGLFEHDFPVKQGEVCSLAVVFLKDISVENRGVVSMRREIDVFAEIVKEWAFILVVLFEKAEAVGVAKRDIWIRKIYKVDVLVLIQHYVVFD